jgi:hypothetical protein
MICQGHDVVILGHCHDLDEFSFRVDGRSGYYLNVGYPRLHGSFLEWTSGEPKPNRIPLPKA